MMKEFKGGRALLLALLLLAGASAFAAEPVRPGSLPSAVRAEGANHHVQGIAIDREAGRMYFSFTTSFVKTDLQGRVLGSIDKIQGHLGAITFNPQDRKVYASLECKDDVIGRGLSDFAAGQSMFYIAIIDVDALDRVGVHSEGTDIFKVVCIREAGADYNAKVTVEGRTLDHALGCSGIDGVTIAPKMGARAGSRNYLYVAYGIYGDTAREDNNYQVLLRYDFRALNARALPVSFGTFYAGGPAHPLDKYFIYTGNTTWGVQNMAYDPSTEHLFLSVYRGSKDRLPNYDQFIVPMWEKPVRRMLEGVPYVKKPQKVVGSAAVPVPGWYFSRGSTGLCPAGDGWWYISENGRDKQTGRQVCEAHLYRWSGFNGTQVPFVREP